LTRYFLRILKRLGRDTISRMTNMLSGEQAALILAQPDNDGKFRPHEARLARALGKKRPLVMLAFAPKAAGTFFRSAVIKAIDGQLVRTVHAQGGRDAQLYLPLLVHYYAGSVTTKTLVTHVHMQALPANRHFLAAFGIRPVIMLRSIPDMMASYWDMLDGASESEIENMGVNFHVPAAFRGWTQGAKQEFLLDMLMPWYVSYFASWRDYAAEAPDDVLVLRFDAFQENPVHVLQNVLRHTHLPAGEKRCREAFAATWAMRGTLRYNQGRAGRGDDYFNARQRDHVHRALARHTLPEDWMDALR
jgi:hypothetical protein